MPHPILRKAVTLLTVSGIRPMTSANHEALRRCRVFKGLSRRELMLVERALHVRHFVPGEVVFHQGEIGVGMYIVVSGTLEAVLEDKPEVGVLATFQRSDLFGELSVIDNDARSATVVCAEEATLLGLFRPDLENMLHYNPRLAAKILWQLAVLVADRLRDANRKRR